MLLLTGLGMAATLTIAILIHVYRQIPTIKAMSPVFCLISLSGLMILYATNILYIGIPTEATCSLIPFWLSISFAMTIG